MSLSFNKTGLWWRLPFDLIKTQWLISSPNFLSLELRIYKLTLRRLKAVTSIR